MHIGTRLGKSYFSQHIRDLPSHGKCLVGWKSQFPVPSKLGGGETMSRGKGARDLDTQQWRRQREQGAARTRRGNAKWDDPYDDVDDDVDVDDDDE